MKNTELNSESLREQNVLDKGIDNKKVVNKILSRIEFLEGQEGKPLDWETKRVNRFLLSVLKDLLK